MMTAEERVDSLSNEVIRQILIDLVKSIEENGSVRCVPDILNDWSLLETKPKSFRKRNRVSDLDIGG
jgi:hypothetical protein